MNHAFRAAAIAAASHLAIVACGGGRRGQRLLGALVMVCGGLLTVASHAATDGEARFTQALKLLKSGSDDQRAVQLLEAAAASGDVGAMYVLGAMNLEGKYVPQDRALGIAYLKVAVADNDPALRSAQRKAQAWIWTGEAEMNGRELIEVDQQFLRLTNEIKANLAARMARATSVFTDEVPVEYEPMIRFAGEPVRLRSAPTASESTPYMIGCGAKPLPTCPSQSKSASETRCTGVILAADTPVSASRENGALLVVPDYPDPALRSGDQGTVRLLAHVDSSGWLCGVAVAVSSGASSLDAAALRAAIKWKLIPATRAGAPIEALQPFGVTFRLSDW